MDLVVPSPALPGFLWAMPLPGPLAAMKTASPCDKLQKSGAGSLLSGGLHFSLWFSRRMEERIGIAPVPLALPESPLMPLALDRGLPRSIVARVVPRRRPLLEGFTRVPSRRSEPSEPVPIALPVGLSAPMGLPQSPAAGSGALC